MVSEGVRGRPDGRSDTIGQPGQWGRVRVGVWVGMVGGDMGVVVVVVGGGGAIYHHTAKGVVTFIMGRGPGTL